MQTSLAFKLFTDYTVLYYSKLIPEESNFATLLSSLFLVTSYTLIRRRFTDQITYHARIPVIYQF